MSIFNIDFRLLFSRSQTPAKRAEQTLDLGESLTKSLQDDNDVVAALNDTLQIEKKYNCVRMVMQASFNEFFAETTFEVETDTNIVRFNFVFNEIERQPIYLYNESEQKPLYFFNESETPKEFSIIVRVPAALFISSLDQVKSFGQKIKVAGKTINYVSL